MSEIFVVFIINKYFVRWESFNQSSTLKDVFEKLESQYNITKCIIEIGAVTFMKKCRFKDMLLHNILEQSNKGTIYVVTKNKIVECNSKT
jgi:hypothetical protein